MCFFEKGYVPNFWQFHPWHVQQLSKRYMWYTQSLDPMAVEYPMGKRTKNPLHGYLNGENDGSPWWFFWVLIFRQTIHTQMNLRHSHLIVRTNNAVHIPHVLTSYCDNHEKFAIVAIRLFLHVLARLHCPYHSLSIRTSWMVFGTGSIRWWIWSESWPSRL